MWGTNNKGGTYKGKLMTVGNRTATTGIEMIMFDELYLKSDNTSFVLNIIAIDTRKSTNSRAIFAKLAIPKCRPYKLTDRGHSNCAPPVRKSPISKCCSTATKYGTALFLYNKRSGTKRTLKNITE